VNKYIIKKPKFRPKYMSQIDFLSNNYKGTGMPYHQWLALKVVKTLLKEKRYPIKWKERDSGNTVVITFY
jgi:hypothetical protein